MFPCKVGTAKTAEKNLDLLVAMLFEITAGERGSDKLIRTRK